MVRIEGRKGPIRDVMVFFPQFTDVCNLKEMLAPTTLLRLRQALVPLDLAVRPIKQNTFETTCIDLTADAGMIWRRMDAKSCRYEIRKAERIRPQPDFICNTPQAFDSLLTLYNNFVRAKGHTRPMSKQRLAEYSKVSDVFVASVDGRPIVGHLLITDKAIGRVRLAYSCSCRLDGTSDAKLAGPLNRLLHWHEIMLYKKAGMHLYDFGGISRMNESISKFKTSFGGHLVREWDYVYAGLVAHVLCKAVGLLGVDL